LGAIASTLGFKIRDRPIAPNASRRAQECDRVPAAGVVNPTSTSCIVTVDAAMVPSRDDASCREAGLRPNAHAATTRDHRAAVELSET